MHLRLCVCAGDAGLLRDLGRPAAAPPRHLGCRLRGRVATHPGGLGVDRDPLAMIPLGIATIISGLLDQRVLARSLTVPTGEWLEGSRVGR